MLLKMSEMSRFCPARPLLIFAALYPSRVSHHNLTTLEGKTTEIKTNI